MSLEYKVQSSFLLLRVVFYATRISVGHSATKTAVTTILSSKPSQCVVLTYWYCSSGAKRMQASDLIDILNYKLLNFYLHSKYAVLYLLSVYF